MVTLHNSPHTCCLLHRRLSISSILCHPLIPIDFRTFVLLKSHKALGSLRVGGFFFYTPLLRLFLTPLRFGHPEGNVHPLT
nr:MAG TPA: hypothetical protein [Caudoviricetes sp.]